MPTEFAYEGGNLTEDQVRDALARVFGDRAAKDIGDGAIPVAMGVNRAPHLPPRDGHAGGWVIALDWSAATALFRLRIPVHSVERVKELMADEPANRT